MELPDQESETLKKEKEELERLEKEKPIAETELSQKGGNEFFGGNQEFYMMKGECYSHRVCIDPCIHRSLTNTNTKLVLTERQHRIAFPIGSSFSIIDSNGAMIRDASRNLHVNEENVIEGGDVFFYWKNGQKCWNGPYRSLKLKLVCGSEVEIRNLVEPSMCVYEGELATPARVPVVLCLFIIAFVPPIELTKRMAVPTLFFFAVFFTVRLFFIVRLERLVHTVGNIHP